MRNEVLFREVNERVGEALGSIAPGENGDHLEIFCKCGLATVDSHEVPDPSEWKPASARSWAEPPR